MAVPQRYALAGLDAAQVLTQASLNAALGVDPVFEVVAVPEFHELMCVTGIAVAATKLAAPVRVQAPGERHAGPDTVERTAGFDLEILDRPLRFENFASGCQTRNTDQVRLRRIAGQHCSIFAFSSPCVKAFRARFSAWSTNRNRSCRRRIRRKESGIPGLICEAERRLAASGSLHGKRPDLRRQGITHPVFHRVRQLDAGGRGRPVLHGHQIFQTLSPRNL